MGVLIISKFKICPMESVAGGAIKSHGYEDPFCKANGLMEKRFSARLWKKIP